MTNEELVARFQSGEDVFEELYEKNKGYILNKASEYSLKSLYERDDLISYFSYLLYRCAQLYNMDAQNKFITFFGTAVLRAYLNLIKRAEYKKVLCKSNSLNNVYAEDGEDSVIEYIDLLPSHHPEFSFRRDIEEICREILNQYMSEQVANMVMEFFLEDYTQTELVKRYGIRRQAVSQNIKRARVILQRELPKRDITIT